MQDESVTALVRLALNEVGIIDLVGTLSNEIAWRALRPERLPPGAQERWESVSEQLDVVYSHCKEMFPADECIRKDN